MGAWVIIIGLMPRIVFSINFGEASRNEALMSSLISRLVFLFTSVQSFMD